MDILVVPILTEVINNTIAVINKNRIIFIVLFSIIDDIKPLSLLYFKYFFHLKCSKETSSQLLATLDIYQALREDRLYRKAFTHNNALELLSSMGLEGKLNQKIINDINTLFKDG